MVKIIGYGVIIWATAYVVASIFVALKITGVLMNIVTTLAMLAAVFYFAKSLKVSGKSDALKYGFIWAIMAHVLDSLITVKFTGDGFFDSWYIWVAYSLVVLTPLLAIKKGAAAA